jgi:hypothetical protein
MFMKLKEVLPETKEVPDMESKKSSDPYVPTSENNDKLVHVYGNVTTDEILNDQSVGIKVENCLRMHR